MAIREFAPTIGGNFTREKEVEKPMNNAIEKQALNFVHSWSDNRFYKQFRMTREDFMEYLE